jgi:DNA-binding SARP family transcriptional activator
MASVVEHPLGSSDVVPFLQLNLLRSFELRRHGESAVVPTNVQRLLAFLAISRSPQHRIRVAGKLWIDSSEQRAGANLRTALWQARRIDDDLVSTRSGHVALGAGVRIDLADTVDRATRLVSDPVHYDDDAPPVFAVLDLLPEWDEEWVLFERERLRQLQLHSVEILCQQLSDRGRYGLAVDAGLAAVAAEPLRESAQRVLIRAHLAEGNFVEALRSYDQFSAVLAETLGIAPSDSLRTLVAPCR